MKAAFFNGPNDIQIRPLKIDNDSNESIVLKVLSCSVCSYDVRTFRNGSFKVKPPIILGHEICAETIDEYIGENFSIKPKTRVSVYPVIPCLQCWYCSKKKYNLCCNLKEIGSTVNGGFAEYISVPKDFVEMGGIIRVLNNISNEEASLVEPLGCCINSINEIRSLDFESVVILGDGPIGLMQLMLMKKYYPEQEVTIIGKTQHRLDVAHRLGADNIFKVDKEDQIRDLQVRKDKTRKNSPNLIFVSNNNPRSMDLVFSLINKGGKVVIFSGIKESQSTSITSRATIDPNFIHYNQVSVYGSFSSTPVNMKEAMNLINLGEIDLKQLITNTYSLSNVKEALISAESLNGLKSIINDFN
jgi:L-iditol 2-dehydrogenase